MVDVSQTSNDIALVGGPSTINLVVDAGPPGLRGSQIFTGPGNPTDEIVQLPSILINDLFINLNPESNDYLFLWQYNSQDGIVAWRKALRLIPNTVLINPLIKFINGQAHTTVPYLGNYIDVKGIFFPLSGFGETTDIENLNPRDFNVQMNLISEKATAMSIDLKEISNQIDVQYIFFDPTNPSNPLNGTYQTFSNFDFQANVLYAEMSAVEYSSATSTMVPITGYRIVHTLATLGGKSPSLVEFDVTNVNETLELISIDNHGLTTGQKVVYLKNPAGTAITGLTDQEEYFVVRVDEDTISLLSELGVPVGLSIGSATGVHALSILGVGL